MGMFDFLRQKRSADAEAAALSATVSLLADEPTLTNRDAFYDALLSSKVGARLPEGCQPSQRDDQDSRSASDQIGVPTTTAPDGTPMLLVYCDIPKMHRTNPDDRFFEIDGRVALEMALTAKCGIIVQNASNGESCWAGVPREDVAGILAQNDA